MFLLIQQIAQYRCNIGINTDRPALYLLRAETFTIVDTYINRLRILCCHLPKRIFDDNRGVMFIAHYFFLSPHFAKRKAHQLPSAAYCFYGFLVLLKPLPVCLQHYR